MFACNVRTETVTSSAPRSFQSQNQISVTRQRSTGTYTTSIIVPQPDPLCNGLLHSRSLTYRLCNLRWFPFHGPFWLTDDTTTKFPVYPYLLKNCLFLPAVHTHLGFWSEVISEALGEGGTVHSSSREIPIDTWRQRRSSASYRRR